MGINRGIDEGKINMIRTMSMRIMAEEIITDPIILMGAGDRDDHHKNIMGSLELCQLII